ncbi:ATP-dependent DNA helicase RecG [Geosporobacter ferrireducens]|uniref:ATP-dependent DNA helicase RecG n=1 Tax=Geosporobacter ferrireducens TaxID=1424294 RepID=A0A1D8GBW8_9FIRM|nr:ATP-dependent DNA helicase RecG [Geosporobacter ferrireducens]AOT68407.1 ATP-dependent DNA helicase RecG [Geosporobacter ferrireducens]MTI53859.1 ATP-dependent DNA helicase RecG [Geosporobacter ferrireducens]
MESLKQPVQYLKGVGPKKQKLLQRLSIFTVEDLIYTFPREYEDRRSVKTVQGLVDGEKTSLYLEVCGKIQEKSIRRKLKIYTLPVKDATGTAQLVFYNTPFIKQVFQPDDKIFVHGKVKIDFYTVQILHPEYSFIKDEQHQAFQQIMPIYRLTEGLSQKDFYALQKFIFSNGATLIQEFLPEDILKKNKLCSLDFALQNIHFPSSSQNLRIAKYRLIFEELLILQLGLLLTKGQLDENREGIAFNKMPQLNDFIKQLPFQLTESQKKVLEEIEEDMESSRIMNRLVQGDVGSGKTIIAIIALYKAVLNNYQSVFMAPTEILAEQHYDTIHALLEPLGVKTVLLSGSITKRNKEKILEEIEIGKVDIVVGTHAVIQDNVRFHKLGLAITDEQHRFGVRQRVKLSNKGLNPDILVMTATPIPRTLALILYGDLDISVIDQLPPGRKAIETYCVDENKRKRVYNFVRKQIQEGRQAYIVCPLIEESENIEARSTVELYEELTKEYFQDMRVGLLHGKMKSAEKENLMKTFKSGEIDLLVSTTVIEVGVNVPNASVMVIENSERFGLAQLHQLRGRVGRGSYQSYCILINYGKNPITLERMKIMEGSTDGFVIAEKDLALRGPGEFFGTRQHGLPELKIANLFKHIKILHQVQVEAKKVLAEDPGLHLEKNKGLRRKLLEAFQEKMEEIGL